MRRLEPWDLRGRRERVFFEWGRRRQRGKAGGKLLSVTYDVTPFLPSP